MTDTSADGAGNTPRRPRADARRNREAILLAARAAFDEDGVLTSLDGIAARAGVGNATLYRNFATRDDLLAAVMQDSIEAALVRADELSRALPPREALSEWLTQLTWQLRIWHDLPHCLASAHREGTSPVQATCDPLLEQTSRLLAAARGAGPAGGPLDAVTGDELYQLVLALSWAVDRFGDDEALARHRVATATAGVLA